MLGYNALAVVLAQTTTGGGNQLTQTQMWMLIGLAAVALVYITVLRPMSKRKDPLDRPSGFATLSQHRHVERDMENLLVELSNMARQITGQLDTRAQKLELLMREADEKIRQLQAASDGSTAGHHRDDAEPEQNRSVAPDPGSGSAPDPPDEPDPQHVEVYTLADQGRDAYEIAAQLGRQSGEIELILALRGRAEG
jgi:hypothetical protein